VCVCVCVCVCTRACDGVLLQLTVLFLNYLTRRSWFWKCGVVKVVYVYGDSDVEV
jgi:hypothetical protein